MTPASAPGRCPDTKNFHHSHRLSTRDLDEQSRLLAILLYSVLHLFGDFKTIFSKITDPRNPKKIAYSVDHIAFTAIFMFMCGLEARRQIGCLLRGGKSGDQCRELFGLPKCPHGDKIDDAFARMNPEEFQAVLCWLVFHLIRKKVLYTYRLLDRYFVVAIDGTWTLTRKTRHCPWCLTKTSNETTTYYHMVLEAKIVTPDGFAIPLFTRVCGKRRRGFQAGL